jgi:hypothetical protein
MRHLIFHMTGDASSTKNRTDLFRGIEDILPYILKRKIAAAFEAAPLGWLPRARPNCFLDLRGEGPAKLQLFFGVLREAYRLCKHCESAWDGHDGSTMRRDRYSALGG